MKNIFVFYALIFSPLLFMFVYIFDPDIRLYFSSDFVVGFLIVYCLLYHPLISGLRLLSLNKITRAKFARNFIPGWNSKYFKVLFFKA
jgi:hypothetical protein